MGLHLTRAEAKALGIVVPSPRKYRNQPVTIDGRHFDSKVEAARFALLQQLERAGELACLLHHPRYELVVKGRRIGLYEADSSYLEGGRQVIEDVKGHLTADYKLKRELVCALYPGAIFREVRLCRGSRLSRPRFSTIDV